jgi:HK97 family phage major capsid protein
MDRLKEIEQRMQQIQDELNSDNCDIDSLEKEVTSLKEERATLNKQIEKRKSLLDDVMKNGKLIDAFIPKEEIKIVTKDQIFESEEYRSAFFKKLLNKPLNEAEKRAFTATNAAAAIPTQTANILFDKMVKIAPMLNEITLLRVAGNVTFAVEGTRNDATLHTENATVTPAADTLTSVSLAGYEIIKVLRISKTVQTMSINAFEGWLVDMLAEDIAEKVEDYIVNGTGDSQPKGIAYATTFTDGSNAVEYTTNVTYSEISEAISYLAARYDKKAKFLCNKKFVYQQLAQILDANGNPILVKDMSAGLQMNLMGYPIIISDKVTDGEMYLGDYTKVVGNLAQGIEVESSTQSGFLNNSIDFRGTALFDCDIALTDAFVKISAAS